MKTQKWPFLQLRNIILPACIAGLFWAANTAAQDHSEVTAYWMTEYKSTLWNLPINKVPILGAHDATSCYLKEDSPPSTGYIEHDGNHLTHLPGDEGISRGKCQSVSITNQLNAGVRYLVLPIAYQNGQYWSIHMWLAIPLFGDGGLFQELTSFLNDHPDEIILLNLRAPLYSDKGPMTAKQEVEFYKKLYDELKALLVPKGNFGKTTFGQIWNGDGRLLIIGNPEGDNPSYPFIWNENEKEDVWMDTTDPTALMTDLTNELNTWTNNPNPDYLFVLQGMTTTREKLQNAQITNSLLRQQFETNWKKYPINIIQVDDAAKSGLMPFLLNRLTDK